MKCAHCGTDFHDEWSAFLMQGVNKNNVPNSLYAGNLDGKPTYWAYRTNRCSSCQEVHIEIALADPQVRQLIEWRQVHPVGANRGPVPKEVPAAIAQDYIEACNVLPTSAKASAALGRRCLQNILHHQSYKGRDLNAEIDLLLGETDPLKAIPRRLRDTIDAIRSYGNFSAHPVTDRTALQIVGVEPGEAEWCLEILEECFEHFYVGPEIAKAKKAVLDAKLAAAGKPPSK